MESVSCVIYGCTNGYFMKEKFILVVQENLHYATGDFSGIF